MHQLKLAQTQPSHVALLDMKLNLNHKSLLVGDRLSDLKAGAQLSRTYLIHVLTGL